MLLPPLILRLVGGIMNDVAQSSPLLLLLLPLPLDATSVVLSSEGDCGVVQCATVDTLSSTSDHTSPTRKNYMRN